MEQPPSGDDSLSIFLGDGDGTFSASDTLIVGGRPFGISVGDFNNDGVSDIGVSNVADGTLSILEANTLSGVSALLPFSLSTKADALQAMAPLDRKIEQLALQKGTIGAF